MTTSQMGPQRHGSAPPKAPAIPAEIVSLVDDLGAATSANDILARALQDPELASSINESVASCTHPDHHVIVRHAAVRHVAGALLKHIAAFEAGRHDAEALVTLRDHVAVQKTLELVVSWGVAPCLALVGIWSKLLVSPQDTQGNEEEEASGTIWSGVRQASSALRLSVFSMNWGVNHCHRSDVISEQALVALAIDLVVTTLRFQPYAFLLEQRFLTDLLCCQAAMAVLPPLEHPSMNVESSDLLDLAPPPADDSHASSEMHAPTTKDNHAHAAASPFGLVPMVESLLLALRMQSQLSVRSPPRTAEVAAANADTRAKPIDLSTQFRRHLGSQLSRCVLRPGGLIAVLTVMLGNVPEGNVGAYAQVANVLCLPPLSADIGTSTRSRERLGDDVDGVVQSQTPSSSCAWYAVRLAKEIGKLYREAVDPHAGSNSLRNTSDVQHKLAHKYRIRRALSMTTNRLIVRTLAQQRRRQHTEAETQCTRRRKNSDESGDLTSTLCNVLLDPLFAGLRGVEQEPGQAGSNLELATRVFLGLVEDSPPCIQLQRALVPYVQGLLALYAIGKQQLPHIAGLCQQALMAYVSKVSRQAHTLTFLLRAASSLDEVQSRGAPSRLIIALDEADTEPDAPAEKTKVQVSRSGSFVVRSAGADVTDGWQQISLAVVEQDEEWTDEDESLTHIHQPRAPPKVEVHLPTRHSLSERDTSAHMRETVRGGPTQTQKSKSSTAPPRTGVGTGFVGFFEDKQRESGELDDDSGCELDDDAGRDGSIEGRAGITAASALLAKWAERTPEVSTAAFAVSIDQVTAALALPPPVSLACDDDDQDASAATGAAATAAKSPAGQEGDRIATAYAADTNIAATVNTATRSTASLPWYVEFAIRLWTSGVVDVFAMGLLDHDKNDANNKNKKSNKPTMSSGAASLSDKGRGVLGSMSRLIDACTIAVNAVAGQQAELLLLDDIAALPRAVSALELLPTCVAIVATIAQQHVEGERDAELLSGGGVSGGGARQSQSQMAERRWGELRGLLPILLEVAKLDANAVTLGLASLGLPPEVTEEAHDNIGECCELATAVRITIYSGKVAADSPVQSASKGLGLAQVVSPNSNDGDDDDAENDASACVDAPAVVDLNPIGAQISELLTQLQDTQPPMRAMAVDGLREFAAPRQGRGRRASRTGSSGGVTLTGSAIGASAARATASHVSTIVDALLRQLQDPDPYVFLAVIRALAETAVASSRTLFPALVGTFTREVADVTRRARLAEVLVLAVGRAGETVAQHVPLIVPLMIVAGSVRPCVSSDSNHEAQDDTTAKRFDETTGVYGDHRHTRREKREQKVTKALNKDSTHSTVARAALRASALAVLAVVCGQAPRAVLPYATDIVSLCEGVLLHEQASAEASNASNAKVVLLDTRRAAGFVLERLIGGLHALTSASRSGGRHKEDSALGFAPEVVRDVYRLSKRAVGDVNAPVDPVVEAHCVAAFAHVDAIMRDFMFPQQQIDKQLHVSLGLERL
jgi:hypothetical protein